MLHQLSAVHASSQLAIHGVCPAPSCPALPSAGRFAFVELRTEELATTAMSLDKTELLGRPMNIGRPKGYVPGTSAPGELSAHCTADTQTR